MPKRSKASSKHGDCRGELHKVRRRALLVGIDHYAHMTDLAGCVDDALALQQMLSYHADHGPNFACRTLLSPGAERLSRRVVLAALESLFAFDDIVLFYYSGHGIPSADGIYLTTEDGVPSLPGIQMNDVLRLANASPAREVLLVLDCCYSGALGEPPVSVASRAPAPEDTITSDAIHVREGITLLAASRSTQPAVQVNGHGMFTRLVIGGLSGGAADVRGAVTAASLYAYVDQALGPWEQRPVYKSNTHQLWPIRYCQPDVSDEELRRLPEFFARPEDLYRLDPTYERTHPAAIKEHVVIFDIFARYRNARLLHTVIDSALYWAAIHATPVTLTPLGQFYWQLAKDGLLAGGPTFAHQRRPHMPDAEAVARLFHETYERLAPAFDYHTRQETAVPWEQVPERNKRLMIAVTAEVLAMLFPQQDARAEVDTAKTVEPVERATQQDTQ